MGKQAVLSEGPPASLTKGKFWQGPCPFNEGDLVESRAFTEGFRDAWFKCKVMAVKQAPGPAAYELTLNAIDFDEDEPFQCQLYESNPGVSEPKWELMLRPLPPDASRLGNGKPGRPRASDNRLAYTIQRSYAIGDAVEYLYNFGWWAGRISELSNQHAAVWWRPAPHGEDGEECHVPLESLRPAMVWDRGQWSFPGHPYGPLGTLTGCPAKGKPCISKPPAAKRTEIGIVSRPAVQRKLLGVATGVPKLAKRSRSAGRRQRESDALPPYSKYSLNTRLSRKERSEIARRALAECTDRADLHKLEVAVRTVLACRPPKNPKKGVMFKVAHLRAILTRCAKTGRPTKAPGYGTKATNGLSPGKFPGRATTGTATRKGHERQKIASGKGEASERRLLERSTRTRLAHQLEDAATLTPDLVTISGVNMPCLEGEASPGEGGVNTELEGETDPGGRGVKKHPAGETHTGGGGVNDHLSRRERMGIARVALKGYARSLDLAILESALRQVMASSPPFLKKSAHFKAARWRQLLAQCAESGEVQLVPAAPKRKPGLKPTAVAGTGLKRGLKRAFEEASSPEELDDFLVRPVDIVEAALTGVSIPDGRQPSPDAVPWSLEWWQRRGDGSGKSPGHGSGFESPNAKDSRGVSVSTASPVTPGIVQTGEPTSPFSKGTGLVAHHTPLNMDSTCNTDFGGSAFCALTGPLNEEPLHAPELQNETDVLKLWELGELGGELEIDE